MSIASRTTDQKVRGSLADQWPSYLAYLVSFATIGAIWLKHTECLGAATSALIRLNLLLLLVVSVLPFPTRLVAEHIGEEQAARVSTTTYGVNLLLASVLIGVPVEAVGRQRGHADRIV